MTRSIILRSHCSFNKVLTRSRLGTRPYPASSVCCPGCTAQHRPASWQNSKTQSTRLYAQQVTEPVSEPERKRIQNQANGFRPCCWAQAVPFAGTKHPRRDLRARGSASTANTNTAVTLVNNHRVRAITDPRERAILHFSLQCLLL